MISCSISKHSMGSDIVLKGLSQTVAIYDTIDDVIMDWNGLAGDNLFLKSSFLKALESTPPSGTSYRYAIIKEDGQVVGIVYYQMKIVNLYESLRLDAAEPKGIWKNITHKLKCFFGQMMKAYLLVNGNMALTGRNNFEFSSSVDIQSQDKIIEAVTNEVICQLRTERKRIRAVLVKDFYSDKEENEHTWNFSKFEVQPNMVLSIRNDWNSFDDYIGAMKSKYRVRVRRARKKAEPLNRRVLSLEEIHAYSQEISNLYKNIANKASFNLFILPPNYFYSLKKHLGDSMEVIGYFDGDRMTGFYTYILNHGDLDAHFLGYDIDCNSNCQLYLNMLYDLVDDAIRLDAKSLILSRTAMEIKSSMGAEAKEMHLYLKLTNPIFNLGVNQALGFFTPEAKWKPRSPFK